MHLRRTRCLTALVGLVTLVGVLGCLERKETIRVHRDGAIDLEIEYSGAPADFAGADAMPSETTGWRVQDQVWKENDRDRQRRRGKMRLPAGAPLPESFAVEGEPLADAALRFPTQVTVERRADGTYYHFRRVYDMRESARYAIHRELLEDENSRLKELMEQDSAEYSPQDHRELLTFALHIEAAKMLEFVRGGCEAVGDAWPQDFGLRLASAVKDVFDKADVEWAVELLQQPQSAERDAELEGLGNEVVAEAHAALDATFVELRVPRAQVELFRRGFELEKLRHAVTENVRDHIWEIRVELPGEIVAHNGEHDDDTGAVEWKFQGKVLMDREHVLMATSRVPRGH